jgi:tRNA A37 threonylcarbamoyladenosine synthetase subunit TsaC/SUA5/YrdC
VKTKTLAVISDRRTVPQAETAAADAAVTLLREGEPVAVPTETVYGPPLTRLILLLSRKSLKQKSGHILILSSFIYQITIGSTVSHKSEARTDN